MKNFNTSIKNINIKKYKYSRDLQNNLDFNDISLNKNCNLSKHDNINNDYSLEHLSVEDTSKDTKVMDDDTISKIEKQANDDTMINTSGKFSNLTDFQNIVLSQVYIFDDWNLKGTNDDGTIVKTIKELYKSPKDEEKKEILGNLIRYGLGDFVIEEVVDDDDSGLDVVILKDTEGNYMLYYTNTNASENQDILYDAYPLISSCSSVFNTSSLLEITTGFGISSSVVTVQYAYSKIQSTAEDYYKNQQDKAQEIAQKYYDKADKEGKRINIGGYSLGGSLAENTYLGLLAANDNNNNILNNLVLLNPYHDRLSSEEVNILKETNKVKLYCSEGDVVSPVYNQASFDDIAKYIYIDYEKMIKTSENNPFNLALFELHSEWPIIANKDVSFNSDGSVKSEVKNNGVHQVTKATLSEIATSMLEKYLNIGNNDQDEK